ncbi:protein Jade-3 [Seriola lalandi dorsalis]|uniref:protein Jade-3 n=1 Tax=Seriola lalandi dorsalis TaxID=1841481 RepID=UPI000C6F65A0|nr:protein Jade-3 [Seriola lalandi dorsalis]XP_023269066.1 protein Jade-3 [Seriola lalandi dorsalis]XP_056234204.1 protein Jade-3 [Seriola aureovittata]
MKRLRSLSSSDSSDNESPSTSFCSSNKYGSKPGTPASNPKKPAEVFRKDLISAMKLPDSHHVSPEDYYLLADTWKQEWEKGVQVPASPETIPEPSVRIIAEKSKEVLYSHQRKYIQCSCQESTEPGYVNIKELAEAMCRYDLDDMDLYWLHALNRELDRMGEEPIDELTMERAMEALERQCHDNMNHAIETVEGLGIEYDEDVICDVCRSPDSEEGNDMVFCDKCNICVHQACYGIVKVPVGNWLCRTCVLGLDPQCLLCPQKGGAMKATREGTKWAHVSCALWIPEVSIACPERMEPITKISHIPPSRWSLICSLCKLKTGACIQCSVKNCTTPFHVTCAFEHSLEMKTILDEGDEVKFKSYCLKHSKSKAGEASLSPARSKPPGEAGKVGQRAQRLQELEEEFYTLIQLEELARALGLSERLADFIYQYWKLKRKSNFNKALLPPKEDEENLVLQPQEDSIHTRMRMFMHLRQDLERVRNLCYMVSRREKLKLLQSKAQEQMFNLHVQLMNQELSAGLPVSFPVENMLFRPPPRITLKLKMPKVSNLGNGNPKSGNGPLCPDNSGNVAEHAGEGLGQGKPQLHGRGRREERSNGRLASSSHSNSPALPVKPTGKPLALHAALHGHSSNSNGKLDQDRACVAKSKSLLEKFVAQKDSSCQTPSDQDASNEALDKSSFRKSAMEHFGRSFKEATINLVRTTEDLRASDKLSRKGSAKERLWAKPVSEHKVKSARSYQDSDGYCPDLELSDSEPEAKGRHRRQVGLPQPDAPRKGVSRGKQSLGSRDPMQSLPKCQAVFLKTPPSGTRPQTPC